MYDISIESFRIIKICRKSNHCSFPLVIQRVYRREWNGGRWVEMKSIALEYRRDVIFILKHSHLFSLSSHCRVYRGWYVCIHSGRVMWYKVLVVRRLWSLDFCRLLNGMKAKTLQLSRLGILYVYRYILWVK